MSAAAAPTFRPASRGAAVGERLDAFPFLQSLSEAARARLAAGAMPQRFDEEARVVCSRGCLEVIPLVERGTLRIERTENTGRRLTLYTVNPGESCILAMAGALQGGDYPAEAVAEAGTEVLLLDPNVVTDLFTDDADFRRYVLDLFAQRLLELMVLVREVAFDRLDVRLARLLLREAEITPGIRRPVELSHAELAARLGSAREVVSRTLQRMKEEGFLSLGRGRVVVEDAEGLRARFEL
jgi:CRP/FNR family transcriptional regulator